ncbi:MAG: chitinase [Serratia rubidaea]|nr:chitinase [Serratia rubidaea]
MMSEINATMVNNAMPDISGKKILMGFWHNWQAGASDGYQQGQFANMNLTDIPEAYNVIAVAFMKGQGIPTFKPYNLTDEAFRSQVETLNGQGRAVLISLGGADAHIELKTGDEEKLKDEIIRLVETYGFDGLDIDLEQAAIGAANNKTVLPAALKSVKAHYAAQGKNFIISMAPEFPYLRTGGSYLDYINALDGVYDFIAPQYYNQGGDGLWVDEANGGAGAWITQNNDAMKEDFLFYLTESLVTGTRGFARIPADKFAIGLPSNVDAAATGYVVDPQAVYNAFRRLDDKALSIKGLMTWSINWDNGKSKSGVPYAWEFSTRYRALIHGNG